MKKIITAVIALTVMATAAAQSGDVTIKRGKATMDEEYYYQIKRKADALQEMEKQNEELQKQLDQANKELKKHAPVRIVSFNDSASYAIGRDIASDWAKRQLNLNLNVVAQSLTDFARGTNNWSQQTMTPILQRFQSEYDQRQKAKKDEMMSSLGKNKEDGARFLKENANNKSVYSTPSGLQYKVLQKGTGKTPTVDNIVRVHYTGTLIDGTKFDSSVDRGVPAEFPVSAVIPGWTEGLQLMNEGSKYIFYIPYNLAYGENPVGDIPPGSTLIFEVELIEIVK